ncbi:MAG: inositol monophosphatase family protein [Cyanobacteria bacterium Co-bin13]|nr:inositol monophosphatase family protein [Cyanobacteria bacterium Co-bin13]
MPDLPTPRQILETLLPQLRVAAAYACEIQSRIASLPSKDADNFFGAALSDADLSVQTFIEVAMLGLFPQVRFFGEEHEKTYNTKYFRGITLGEQDDYLVTLDPIDGTRFYLDGHPNFQIILSVLNRDDFEAAIAITPAQNVYYYALRGQGAFKGHLQDDLEDCVPLQVESPDNKIFLGFNMGGLAAALQARYSTISISTDYSPEIRVPSVNGLFSGEIVGSVLAKGNFIDGAALAFIAREMGYIASTLDGSPLPPLHTCENYQLPGLVVAATEQIHQDLLQAIQTQPKA